MWRIGLTGGIGSGKSTVSALFAARGAAVSDTDAIARRLTLPGGAAIEAVVAAFGAQVLDATGALDRERMRALAFADACVKQQLEAILHPLIRTQTEREAAAAMAASPSRTLVFDVPLLVESGRWRGMVDRVLVIDCLEATQVQRVVQRAGWSEQAVRAVIAQQASREARLACADAVIYNEGLPLDALAREVDALWTHWHCLPQG